MIPKIIHFVWVGDQPKPELVQKCMASWTEFCPDYRIIEWGNDSLERIENRYVQEAAAMKKWAFVSDYIRLFALKEIGGFYFDSDLELTNDISEFREFDFVTGFEKNGLETARPITALMGSSKSNDIVCDLLEEYNSLKFKNNGTMDLMPNSVRITNYFQRKFGLKRRSDGETKIILKEGSVVFPYYYFCTPEPDRPNYSIHHFNGSWVESVMRRNIISVGKWRLLKFSFRFDSEDAIRLSDKEKLIYSLTLNISKKRVFALVAEQESC